MNSLGDRIKRYESVYQYNLTPRSCLFIRIDGKAFHTFTRGLERPFSALLMNSMVETAKATAKQMQGFKLAYVQSDEATFLLTDFDTLDTQGWFGYELSKVVSISASIFTANFNRIFKSEHLALFDSRAFIVPNEDALNVFIWRQRDWERNSIQMFAKAHFSHKQLDNKSISDIHEMLHQKGLNWANITEQQKNGTFIFKGYETKHFKATYQDLDALNLFNAP